MYDVWMVTELFTTEVWKYMHLRKNYGNQWNSFNNVYMQPKPCINVQRETTEANVMNCTYIAFYIAGIIKMSWMGYQYV